MRLVSETEVQAQAEREAGRIIAAAEPETERMQREIDDYIDAKLANFELVLTKTLEAVARGSGQDPGPSSRRGPQSRSGCPSSTRTPSYGSRSPSPTPQAP